MSGNGLVRTAAISAAVLRALFTLLALPGVFAKIQDIQRTSLRWSAWPLTIAGLGVDAVLPLFCAAVFLNKHNISVPPKQRFIARVAGFALVLLVILTDQYFGIHGQFWAQSHDAGVFHDLRLWFTPTNIAGVLNVTSYLAGQFGLIAYGVLLTGLSRSEGDDDVAVSNPFRSITKVAAFVWGVIASGAILRLFVMPNIYSNLFDVARSNGRTLPGIGSIIRTEIGITVPWICLFVAPYVIRKGFQKAPPVMLSPDGPIPQPLSD